MHRTVVSYVRLAVTGLAISSALLSCAHAWKPERRMLSAGQFAYQAQVTRAVWCIETEDMRGAQCQAVVEPAIAALNHAANHALLRFAGVADPAVGQALYKQGALVIMSGNLPEIPEGMILGYTPSEVNAFGAIVRTIMVLNSRIIGSPGALSLQAIVQHELMHAVGFAHSALGSSMIFPAYQGVLEYSEYDHNSLRAAYGD